MRNLIHFELASYGRTDFLLGNTGESSNTGKLLIGNTHTYTQMLRNSLCSVSAPGAGFDCARFYEILGAHTLLIAYEPPIEMPNPFIDGIHLLYFSSLSELREKVDFVLSSPISKIIEIINAGKNHFVEFHTSLARARYLVETLENRLYDCQLINMNELNV